MAGPEGAVEVTAEPGDAVFFDRRIWHTRSRSYSQHTRKAVFFGYTYRWTAIRDDIAPMRASDWISHVSRTLRSVSVSSPRPNRRVIRVRPRLGVPPGMRGVMIGACLGVFAAFSILGPFSSLVPTFLHGILAVQNLALIGAASFLIFITAAISQAVFVRLPARRSVSAGLPLLLVALAALESALFAKAQWLFLAGTIAGGIAVGFVFRGGLSESVGPARNHN
jgi:hypothetical protein